MTTLEQDCDKAVGELRAAFIDLYDSIGADPSSPQGVARQLKLNKTLTWNLAKLIGSPDDASAMVHIPGMQAIEKTLAAMAQHGGSPEAVRRVRQAAEGFHRIVEIHAGDRATFDLILEGRGISKGEALEQSRRLAFTGNSGIFGIQARAKLLTAFLMPNADDPALLDIALIRGHIGLRRLRPAIRHTIFRSRRWSEGGQSLATRRWEPIEEGRSDFLMRSVGRGEPPPIDVVDFPGGTDFVIPSGPVGNRGAFDCYIGDMIRAGASRYRTGEDTAGEFGATTTVPTEHLVFDILCHRTLTFATSWNACVYVQPSLQESREGAWDDAIRLPIEKQPVALAGSPPAVATPLVPGYPDLVEGVLRRLGAAGEEFRGLRFELRYPPLGSTVMLRADLTDAP